MRHAVILNYVTVLSTVAVIVTVYITRCYCLPNYLGPLIKRTTTSRIYKIAIFN